MPIPLDLCGAPEEQAIRKRVSGAKRRKAAKSVFSEPLIGPLVPCKHGVVRFLRFSVAGRDVVVIVEEDRRPSYLSGGSDFRGFALVDGVLHGLDSLWQRIRKKGAPSKEELAHLFVAAVMLQMHPDIVVNDEQKQAVVKRWPETGKAFSLGPPGLYEDDQGRLVLRAWVTHSYFERGISCRYLEGWRVTFEQNEIQAQRTSDYATGTNMGRPCGRDLPR